MEESKPESESFYQMWRSRRQSRSLITKCKGVGARVGVILPNVEESESESEYFYQMWSGALGAVETSRHHRRFSALSHREKFCYNYQIDLVNSIWL